MHGPDWYTAEAIGTAFCLLADVISQMLLSNGSDEEVHKAFQEKINAFL
jgi:hypothetical protein